MFVFPPFSRFFAVERVVEVALRWFTIVSLMMNESVHFALATGALVPTSKVS
jgi:hypothetical protein